MAKIHFKGIDQDFSVDEEIGPPHFAFDIPANAPNAMTLGRAYQLSELSMEIYKDNPSSAGGFVRTSDEPSQVAGFFAAAYVNPDDSNDIVLVFRGTSHTDIYDVFADQAIAGIDNINWDVQFGSAIQFVKQMKLRYPTADISVTGHSLGGSLAQVVAHMFGLKGATFDPGGAENIVNSSEFNTEKSALGPGHGNGPHPSFVNYTMRESPISGWSGDHVGQVEELPYYAQVIGSGIVISAFSQSYQFALNPSTLNLADATANFINVFNFHSIRNISAIMGVRAGGSYDNTNYARQNVQNIVDYTSQNGGIGISGPEFDANVPTYTLTEFRNRMMADNGANQISGSLGDDTIYALAGNDTVDAGAGTNIADGGAGIDTIAVNLSAVTTAIVWDLRTNSYSGPGSYTGFERFGTVITGSGNDIIISATGIDESVQNRDNIQTGAGDDRLTVFDTTFSADLGSGFDTFIMDFRNTDSAIFWYNIALQDDGSYWFYNSFYPVFGASGVERFELYGGAYDDRLDGGRFNDILNGGDGNDFVYGWDGDDTLDGGAGNDTVDVGTGINSADGGAGIDTISVNLSAVTAAIVWDLRTNSYSGPGSYTGFERFGTVITGSGNDIIISATGIDESVQNRDNIQTGAGDDRLTVFDTAFSADLGSGFDTFIMDFRNTDSAIFWYNIALQDDGSYWFYNSFYPVFGASGVERFELYGGAYDDRLDGGRFNDILNGGDGNDFVYGWDGDDTLDGGLGADTLIGGAGNDVLTADFADVSLDGGSGTDTLIFATSGTLSALTTSFEALTLNDGGVLTITSDQLEGGFAPNSTLGGNGVLTLNMGSDTSLLLQQLQKAPGSTVSVIVNAGNNANTVKAPGQIAMTYNGGSLNDNLRGSQLGDTIIGGGGNDKLFGTGGADFLTGGAGNDQFRYVFASDSGTGANADRITDFLSGIDKLNFALLDADPVAAGRQALSFIDTAAFTATGAAQVRYAASGADLLVQVDLDGNGTSDMEIVLAGAGGQVLTGGDFML